MGSYGALWIGLAVLAVARVGLWLVESVARGRRREPAIAHVLSDRERLDVLQRYTATHTDRAGAPRPAVVPLGVGASAHVDAEGLRARSFGSAA